MSSAPLLFVLGLLRRIKVQPEFSQGQSAFSLVKIWTGNQGAETEIRFVIAIQQNLAEAKAEILSSVLDEEAKEGLLLTLDGLIRAFSLDQINAQLLQHVPAIQSAITNFAILNSKLDLHLGDGFAEQRDSLVADFEAFLSSVDGFDIDDRLKDVVRRQISLLISLLRSAEAVGVEVALATYAELLIKVRNRIDPKDEKEKSESNKLWEKIMSWSERLDALMKFHEAGQKMLPYIDKIPQIPGLY